MMRVLMLTLASMGFGSMLTILLTKPPVVSAAFSAAAKLVLGVLGVASHTI